ncbi:hypothetical protein PM082_006944 [Marasmius tenuissimus]|nr:hypothetical protein PM082_006944 [Marasmius tenuissimus]
MNVNDSTIRLFWKFLALPQARLVDEGISAIASDRHKQLRTKKWALEECTRQRLGTYIVIKAHFEHGLFIYIPVLVG